MPCAVLLFFLTGLSFEIKCIIIIFFAFVKRGRRRNFLRKSSGRQARKRHVQCSNMVSISAKTMYTASCIDAAASALRSPGGAGRSRGPGRMPATTYGRRISRAGSGGRTAITAIRSPLRTIEARYDSSSYRKAVNCVPCPYTAVSRVALAACLAAIKRAAPTLPDRSLRTFPRPAGDPPSRSAGA